MIRRLRQLARDRSGTAAIELALCAPILATMVIGVTDISIAYGKKLELEQAAQRAMEKVMQTTGAETPEDTIKIEAVCQYNGTDCDGVCLTAPITTANVTVTYSLTCDGAATDYAWIVRSGQAEVRYITTTVSDTHTPMFDLHFGTSSDGTYHLEGAGRGSGRMKLLKRIKRDESGAAIIEMAFALPVLIVLIWMVVQLGLVLRAMSGIQHALGEGARLATIWPVPEVDDIQDRMNEAVYGIGPGRLRHSGARGRNGGRQRISGSSRLPTARRPTCCSLPGPTINVSRTKRVWRAETDYLIGGRLSPRREEGSDRRL